MLIMRFILFPLSHENCVRYGNGNSQFVGITYGSRDNSLTIQATCSLMKLGMCADYACHYFFSMSHKNCGCYGNKNSQNVAPVVYLCVAGNTCACYTCLRRCTVACCSTISLAFRP